ncbi:hypothetical protein Poly30_08300 [Planctomycetes bacterium Poly30]|uniref:Glycoamylase-like domain-containing protein n=1 Tax=Saltatorellus ferox TaxID=2528018 RepID=A0A518EMM1_9BACT|nr:hypothetical protein Poly30_08300 [Planctomycetes bacterium Poly30]
MHFFATACAVLVPLLQVPGGEHGKPDVPAFTLAELKERTFDFFWDCAHPDTGQIPDRFPSKPFSSIAATGFGLSAYLVGIENGHVERTAAASRVLMTLDALWSYPQGDATTGVAGYRGFYYHFLTMGEGDRFKKVELSTIDTALLMTGVLAVGSYFDQDDLTECHIRTRARELYERVEWDWAMQADGLMSMGWLPEKGFIPARWEGYSEAMVLLILAMGSPTHPISDESWACWCKNYRWLDFYEPHLNFESLFGHQYSHMFIDFRGIQDEFMRERSSDYFENSRIATLANRDHAIRNPGGFVGYGEWQWGLTASDGPPYGTSTRLAGKKVEFKGYAARGASGLRIVDDGTLSPSAVAGSLPFLPELCESTLEHLWVEHHESLVGQYGFKDAFNLTVPGGWFDPEYLGIDQGLILLMAENRDSELLWSVMKRSDPIVHGLLRAGFSGGWLEPDTAPSPGSQAAR